jgi:hypothetical protein
MAYTVLNARVKQKIATEAYWLSIESELGPIFEGEQAFVFNDAGDPINFKIGDGTRLFSELPYFIAYYTGVTAQKILSYLTQTANITIPSVFKNNTLLQDIVFLNNSGSDISLNIGTTSGGGEIWDGTVPNGPITIGLKKQFTSAQTLYFTGLTGKAFSMFILYYQLDEAPAIPPTGTGASGGFAYGTVYAFIPLYTGHENAAFNLTTGAGQTATQYEGCQLFGTGGLPDLSDTYLIGYTVGGTIGGDKGSNSPSLTIQNMPKMKVQSPHNTTNVNGGASIKYTGAADTTQDLAVMGADGTPIPATPTPLNNRPKSKEILYFTGPPTT